MKRHNFKLVVLFTLFTTSVAIAYTESPGLRKGVFFKDCWNRIWFLRASAIAVGKSVAEDATKLLGKPVVFNVTGFDQNYMPREYRTGSIANDEACQKQSENLDISIGLKQQSGKQGSNIPALEIRIQNLDKHPLIFRDWSLMIHIFREDTRKNARNLLGPTEPYVGMLEQLADIQCQQTDFVLPQKEWSKQPNLKSEDTHRITVPIINYRQLSASSKHRQMLKLTEPDLRLVPGKYQILVSYFNEYQNIRKLSNTIELNVKGRPPQQNNSGSPD